MRRTLEFLLFQVEEVILLVGEVLHLLVRTYDQVVPYVRAFGPVALSYGLALAALYIAVTL